jgi:hypothetical protein
MKRHALSPDKKSITFGFRQMILIGLLVILHVLILLIMKQVLLKFLHAGSFLMTIFSFF